MKSSRTIVFALLVILFILPAMVQFYPVGESESITAEKMYLESYTHHDQIWIQSNEEFHAQAALESWTGDGSKETPYVITGYLFDCESQPLRIWHTTVYWIFTDNIIDGVGSDIQCGSWIENVTNGAIVDNEVHNRHAGLAIADIENFTITDNYIHDCWGRGIELFGEMEKTLIQNNIIENIGMSGIYSVTSRECTIKDNSISNVDNNGIALMGSSPGCIVTGNTISNCVAMGIMVAQCENGNVSYNTVSNVVSQGVYLYSPVNCIVTGNIIHEVDGSGLRILNSEFGEITDNEISNCTENGVFLGSGENTTVQWNLVSNSSVYSMNLGLHSSHIIVRYNTFIGNGETCQIYDAGTSNDVTFNFYDDWVSPDEDSNGFVDLPYCFDGSAENKDEYPLVEAGIVPEITTTVTTTTTQTSTITNTTTTTTYTNTGTTQSEQPMLMQLALVGGAVVVIVVISGILILKRH